MTEASLANRNLDQKVAHINSKIIVLDMASEFGGHQAMAVRLIDAIRENYQNVGISLIHSGSFRGKLQNLMQLGLIQEAIEVAPLSRVGIFGVFPEIAKFRSVVAAVKRVNGNAIIAIPGGLEGTTQPVLIARILRLPLGVYVPMVHSLRLQNAKLSNIRDYLAWKIMKWASTTAVISPSQVVELNRHFVPKPTLIPNPVIAPLRTRNRAQNVKTVVGLVGRLELFQKGHDLFVDFLSRNMDKLPNYDFLIIGDGAGLDLIRDHIKSRGLEIAISPWTENWPDLVDVVIMPSRFEGVPLVMLDALANGIPVISSPAGGSKDCLPEHWIFELSEDESWLRAIKEASEKGAIELATRKSEYLKKKHTLDNFKQSVVSWVGTLIPSKRKEA